MPRQLNIKQIFKNGFTDLVPIKTDSKAPAINDWPNFIMSMPRLEKALSVGMETFGLKAKYFPGVDIDVMAPGLAKGIREVAIEMLGIAPTRYGQRPKSLLLYRTNTPFRKFTLRFQSITDSSITGAVEVLGDGQQYVISGKHPTAGMYEYETGEDLDLIHAEELTEINEEQVKNFLAMVESRLDPKKWEVIDRRSGASTAIMEAVDPETLLGPSIQAVRLCVEQTPNDTDWDGFAEFGLAIFGATGGTSDGAAIFREWALRWKRGDAGESDIVKLWRTATPRSGWNRLQWLAEKFGTTYTTDQGAQFDFDLPVAPNYPIAIDDTYDLSDVASAGGVIGYIVANDRLRSIRYDIGNHRWMYYVDGCWQGVSAGLGVAGCEEQIKHLLNDMAEWMKAQPSGANDTNQKLLNNLTGQRMFTAVRMGLQREKSFWVSEEDFDNPITTNHLINTPDGTYDLTQRKMLPHNPDDRLRRMTKISPKFDSTKHPIWTDLLSRVLGNAEAINYLKRYLGSAMGGRSSGTKALLVMLGDTNSGKSTITDTIGNDIMGTYGVASPDNILLQKPKAIATQHPAGLAYILNARFVTLHEGTIDKEWNSGLVKQLTGGDTISSRKMRENFEGGKRFHGKIVLSCNDLPMMDTMDSGMRERVAILEFTPIPDSEKKLDADEKIRRNEAAYVFGWLIEGYAEELLNPVAAFDNRPEVVQEASDAVFADNPIDNFIEACIDVETEGFTKSSDLCEAYNRFVNDEGSIEALMTTRQFGKYFKKALFQRSKSKKAIISGRSDGTYYRAVLKTKNEFA